MPRRRLSRERQIAIVALVAVAAFAAGYLVGRWRSTPAEAPATATAPPARPGEPRTPADAEFELPPSEAPAPSVAAPAPSPPPAPAAGARVALVIDDVGRRVEDVTELEALKVPLSYGVLPFESRTSAVIAELERHGAEYLCHLPMEARNGADPGPGALTRGMSAAELDRATRWALDAVRGASGVNNHMGSAVMADADALEPVLKVLAERELFFLDSRTSPDTVGYAKARELGIPAAERKVFLDPESGAATVREQFRRLLEISRREGSAIAIGHPHQTTIAVLREEVPRALEAGYEFVPVSFLVDRGGDALR
ncbi:MAG: divergent polysaccharide deacetylase family protein [Thermoanaerobaculia bacterium]|nr:divergent polysaccharide deacetylase family protein [Thermoanaerobaculia bacterium]